MFSLRSPFAWICAFLGMVLLATAQPAPSDAWYPGKMVVRGVRVVTFTSPRGFERRQARREAKAAADGGGCSAASSSYAGCSAASYSAQSFSGCSSAAMNERAYQSFAAACNCPADCPNCAVNGCREGGVCNCPNNTAAAPVVRYMQVCDPRTGICRMVPLPANGGPSVLRPSVTADAPPIPPQ